MVHNLFALRRRGYCGKTTLLQGMLLACLFVLLSGQVTNGSYREGGPLVSVYEGRKETRREIQDGYASWYGMHVLWFEIIFFLF